MTDRNDANAAPVLTVRGLKKRIGGRDIIHGLSFDVYGGEVFGFLGPNGSGKTTTIRMLVDLIRPTEGQVLYDGKDIRREHDEALSKVGCIVENPEMYPYMSGWENLEHFAAMLPGVGAERIAEVAALVGLDTRIHDKVKTYSLGMRQRLGIAQALLGRPKLLILDEPTNGLDPQGIKELRVFIRGLAEQGVSVFVSSHLLSEIELMCDRVGILSKGRLLAVDRVDKLLARSTETVLWTASPAERALALLLEAGEAKLDEAGTVSVRMAREEAARWNRKLLDAGVEVHGIEIRQPALEDLFLELTEGDAID
ncbi:ABC transporter ATP-binding protein [Paenibacillus antri]|uniref:ABC transporter ATP-binding protein n=1 Tax=Paenibacillus antri TaxID=2582848 RepID=A0A5R9G9Q8_9BACL|nr:ABC transporter ATP-binding protein [Paenibacillus antri]TLS53172.1 ABC transporter ATP-binding protein [Paenibacillus antri]